ncbi:MAG: DegT/DnrJ/EryC1/StrS family aminotransferase [Deltaproteobacteria bacterium]|nr:DegT/DnrJ/EryC1/StrS family aminotransferase [Deltaproteobacteria bacterium]MCZ6823725.1 DegT/DnrJ/EryC1/StrS family aminotransferase [Deltaproteobacteria bacterium]TDI98675.1 MAG: DegT/DnrJ/EryC1/StrS family aminotransferase [Deltaproteobacteria bacterium]
MPAIKSKPALLGGPKTVTRAFPVWPRVDDEVVREVTRVMTSEPLCPVGNTGIQGEFERSFASFHGRRFGLATSSGTAALMLSVHGAGVEPGDEVIVSPFTWGASISCVLQCAAIPVFADIDRVTLALDPESVRARITPRTRAIVLVHLFGYPAEMEGLLAVADEHGLAVIEDCAQAAGGLYKGRRLGSLGQFGAFSLQASKNLTGGEGGILICDDRRAYERAMSLGTHPLRLEAELELDEFRQRIDSLAYSFRMHTACAAMANTQLKYLDDWTQARNRNARRFYDAVRELPFLQVQEPPGEASGSRHAYYRVPFLYVPDVLPIDRDLFSAALRAEGVPAQAYVRVPFYLRPRFRQRDWLGRGFPWSLGEPPPQYKVGDCPVAEALCAQELELEGSLHEDVPELIEQIADAIAKVGESAQDIAAASQRGGLVLT